MPMNNDFCAFILSHGRAKNVITYKTLLKCGYTGKIYIVIDNEDKQQEEYKKIYGDKVIVFDKKEASKSMDIADNFGKRNVILFARNICFKLAEDLGIKNFVQLDDDYNEFKFRKKVGDQLSTVRCKNIDDIFTAMVDFLYETNVKTVAFAQGGDLMGGLDGQFKYGFKRKAMNSFFCRTDNKFDFAGYLNEDVNTYTMLGSRGDIFLTVFKFMLNQKQTQTQAGGITDAYLQGGTYVKSFYSVIHMPSCIKVEMSKVMSRFHHRINWNNCVPKILEEKYKKI